MSKCQCGFDNADGAKFCAGCGKPQQPAKPKCSSCGMDLEATARFCHGCGTPVADAGTATPVAPTPPPPPPVPTISDAEIQQILAKIDELNGKLKPLNDELAELKNKLADNLPVGVKEIGSVKLTVRNTGGTFTTAGKREFQSSHPAKKFPDLYSEKKTTTFVVSKAMPLMTADEKQKFLTPIRKIVVIGKVGETETSETETSE